MKKTILFLTTLLLLISFYSCKDGSEDSSLSESVTDTAYESAADESVANEVSQQPTLKQMYEGYAIKEITRDRYLVSPIGESDTDREHYITNGSGQKIARYYCKQILSLNNLIDNDVYYVRNSDSTAFFINGSNGRRIDNITYDRLFYVVGVYYIAGGIFGQIGDEYFIINENGVIDRTIDTSPQTVREVDGMRIVKAFNYDGYYYGVTNTLGQYILQPELSNTPTIRNKKIFVDNNASDPNDMESFIYDDSGKLVKKINGYFETRYNFDYIIECEVKDRSTEEKVYSILDYSGKTLYAAEHGVSIGLASGPYHVELGDEIIHLEKLIDGVQYPPVVINEHACATDIDPETAYVIQTPYLIGQYGPQFEITDELKESLKTKVIEYFLLAEYSGPDGGVTIVETDGEFYAHGGFEASYYGVIASTDFLMESISDTGDTSPVPDDPFAEEIVQRFCQIIFGRTTNLKITATRYGYLIYEEKDSFAETALSIAQKRVELYIEWDTFCAIKVVDISDKSLYPTYSFDAISYEEALGQLRSGNYIPSHFSQLSFDCSTCNIEGAEYDYFLVTDCSCEECDGNIGYYIPCYNFKIRDKYSPEYVGEILVPAIDINELNSYLESESLPNVNHYWNNN